MKKTVFVVFVLSFLMLPLVFAGGRKMGELPAPRLVAPGEIVELSEKGIEFRWTSQGGGNFDHYDFRLYRGTQTYEKNLVLQKDVPTRSTSVTIDTTNFAAGETYAWSLRSKGARKSLSSFSIFKVNQSQE